MTDTGTEETRISELLWRTIKLRVSLLALAILALLVVWSAVLSGNRRANSVDVEYCRKFVALTNASMSELGAKIPAPVLPDADLTCSTATARSYVENERALNVFWRDTLGSQSKAAQKNYSEREVLLSKYDAKRTSSYAFQIQLSSEVSSGQLFLNALTVAEIVPFVILGLATTVIILGFQQRAYKARLSQLAYENADSKLSILARTQFFTFPTFAAKRNSFGIKWPTLSVEGIAIGGLAVALVLAWFGLLFAFAENVIHLTDSITHNYLSELYGVAFLLAFWLLYTRRSYRETLGVGAEGPVDKDSRAAFQTLAERFLVVVALVALLLPWARSLGGFPLKGYWFILPERPVALASRVFPISPRLFSELRWQLAIALTFVVVCGVETFLRRRGNLKSRTWLYPLRAMLAALTLYWSLNLLLYMGVLEYEAVRGTSWGLQTMLSNAMLGQGAGLPLDLYDPSYGFLIFLAACLILIRFSIRDLV
jgi:hypothetical protein